MNHRRAARLVAKAVLRSFRVQRMSTNSVYLDFGSSTRAFIEMVKSLLTILALGCPSHRVDYRSGGIG